MAVKALMLWLIRFYREQISPGKPPTCRFIPSCSTYALEAVEVHGALKGGALALWRVLRCHPFHKEKGYIYDPVPKPRAFLRKCQTGLTPDAASRGEQSPLQDPPALRGDHEETSQKREGDPS